MRTFNLYREDDLELTFTSNFTFARGPLGWLAKRLIRFGTTEKLVATISVREISGNYVSLGVSEYSVRLPLSADELHGRRVTPEFV